MAVEASGAPVTTDTAPTAPAEASQHSETGHTPKVGFAALAVGSIGVVFGDIGTSPLYAFKAAMDEAIAYANERLQFGQKLIAFPRVADKIAMMAAEIMIARQISYYAAREKDKGRRCDLEAGMAKLLAARVAWAAADNAVQIHGGNGFALECRISRILCDARILSIFEGAAEIQAQVIARRLLDGGN